jgi:hypothetical protein
MLNSLVASCKRHHVDLFAYLEGILSPMPSLPPEQLGELLPDVWFASHPSAGRKAVA